MFLVQSQSAFSIIWTLQLDKAGRNEISLELDPYYSCINYVLGLTQEPIPKKEIVKEGQVYLHMLKNFYLPRYILFESSVYPLPLAGVYIKKYANNFYEKVKSLRDSI